MSEIKENNPNRVEAGRRVGLLKKKLQEAKWRREFDEKVKEEMREKDNGISYGYIVGLIGVLAGGALVFLSIPKPTHTTMTEILPPQPKALPPPPPSPKTKFVSTLEPFSD